MSIDLTTLSTREVLSAVYIGYYNRAADAAGVQFWEKVISDTSLDLVAVATDFSTQSETQAVHPFFADPTSSTPSTFITSLYQNLFNRDPDAAGLEFWSGQLQNAIDGVEGSFSVGEIIVKIIEIKRDGQRAALQHNALMLMPPVGDSKGYDGHPAQFRSGAGGKGDGEGHLSDSPSLTEPLQKSF